MASFVHSSTDALPDHFSSPIIRREASAHLGDGSVNILEWPNGHTANAPAPGPCLSCTLAALTARHPTKLRIVFAPLPRPTPQSPNGLHAFFDHFKIPSEFVSEHLRAVTHSFGWQREDESTYVCWLHAVCKNIEVIHDTYGVPSIEDPRNCFPRGTQKPSEDGTWLRSGVFYRWKQSTPADNSDSRVEMVIFSSNHSLQRSFENLVPHPDWNQALQDPFCLLVTVLDDLFRQVDTTIWKVLIVLRSVEHAVLRSAETGATGASFDFVAMYNIAKHIIHLNESSTAAYLTACEMSEAHRQLMSRTERANHIRAMEGVQQSIQHKLTLLEGCKVRVESLDKRTQNMTNLAFNTVNQQDSHTMKSDSQSMKVIAIVTMLFLPAATIGSICGSQFFNFNSETHQIMISVDFKFFWAITLPLTALVFGVYLLWQQLRDSRGRHLSRVLQFRKLHG